MKVPYARPLFGMWRREATQYVRERSRVVASIVSPFMWIAIVGIGIERGLRPELASGLSYLEFIVPGIVAQALMFTTIFYGVYIVWDRKMDVLKAVLVTPVPRSVVFLGKVVGGATQAVVEGTLLLVISTFFVDILWVNVAPAFAVILLTAILYTSFGLALGSFYESFEGFRITSTFIAFPMFFLSGALFPVVDLPTWLTWFTHVNPLTYSVDALRSLLVGGQQAFSYWTSFGVLAGYTALATLVGGWSFDRMEA